MPAPTSPQPQSTASTSQQPQTSFSPAGTAGGITSTAPSPQRYTQPQNEQTPLPAIQPAPTQLSIQSLLPPAGTFDFIPSIHGLLARLLLDPADKNALQVKDLVDEVAVIKRAIGAAKAIVGDMQLRGGSLLEQEREIERVRERIGWLRGLIGDVGSEAAESVKAGSE